MKTATINISHILKSFESALGCNPDELTNSIFRDKIPPSLLLGLEDKMREKCVLNPFKETNTKRVSFAALSAFFADLDTNSAKIFTAYFQGIAPPPSTEKQILETPGIKITFDAENYLFNIKGYATFKFTKSQLRQLLINSRQR